MRKKKQTKQAWRHIKCDHCGKPLTNPCDMVIYNLESGTNEISELSFRHSGSGCDDKTYKNSRPVKEGFGDLAERWNNSPYNKKDNLQ